MCRICRVLVFADGGGGRWGGGGGEGGHKLRHNVIYTLISRGWVDIFDVETLSYTCYSDRAKVKR